MLPTKEKEKTWKKTVQAASFADEKDN